VLRRFAADGPFDVLVRDFADELFAGQSFVRSVWTLKHPNRYRPDWLAALLGVERRRLAGAFSVSDDEDAPRVASSRQQLLSPLFSERNR
jgi:hypothetical protein